MAQQRVPPSGRASGPLEEPALIRRWRSQQFAALGFSPVDARALAKSQADLGEVRRLVQSGCPLETARRIAT